MQKLIQNDSEALRPGIQVYSRVLHLIILFYQKAWRSVETIGRNYDRFIQGQEHTYRVGLEVVRTLKSAPKHIDNGKFPEKLFELRMKLERIAADPNEAAAFNYFDFLDWLSELILESQPSKSWKE